MAFMTVLPLTLMYAIVPLTVVYIYPISFGLVTGSKTKRNPIDYPDSAVVQQVTEKNYCKKLAHLTPLIFTSGIYIGFAIIHIFSAVRLYNMETRC